MILWLCGIVGYLIVGILIYDWILRQKDLKLASPGLFGFFWPCAVIVLIIAIVATTFDTVANKINEDRGFYDKHE